MMPTYRLFVYAHSLFRVRELKIPRLETRTSRDSILGSDFENSCFFSSSAIVSSFLSYAARAVGSLLSTGV